MPTTTRPNILLVHADQHRADCLGAAGNPDVQTPNIDALAAEGVRYENSFCPYPVCTPSRYSLLCGLYVRQHLGWTNHCTLPPAIPTLPRALRDTGYQTAAVGKMHFTPTYLDVGFETMRLAEQDGPGRFDDDYHRWLQAEGLVDRLDLIDQRKEYRDLAPDVYWETVGALRSDLDEAHHSTTWIAERALEVLDGWAGGEHMLMVGFVKPHHPFDPPAPWDEMYDPQALTLLPGWLNEPPARDVQRSAGYFRHAELTEAQVRRAMAYYYATLSQIDHHVGRMVDLLRRRGLYENTLIVYTSDHGDYMGFHHLLLKGGTMYDPLVKVPLIIKWPGQARAGGVTRALVNNLDVAPTLLRAAGCAVPSTMQGLDLASPAAGRDAIFTEGWIGDETMVRTADGKLLWYREPSLSRFYDLRRDPLELEDRIDDPAYASQISDLREALMRWALYDARPPTYLDYAAPVAPADNVPPRGAGHAEALADYFARRMAEPFEFAK